VHPARSGRDRDAGIDDHVEDLGLQDIGAMHAHRADLDDPVLAHVEAGGLGIEDDDV